MATIQERLQFKRSQIDTWSTREKLVLASAVVRSGDQNWMSVSRVLKPFAEPGRPPDWFSQKNCAVQYAALLENAEMPKRKKRCLSTGEKKDFSDETPGQSIVRMLTQERVEELHRRMAEEKTKYLKCKEDIILIESGRADDKLDQWAQEAENDKKQKVIDAENHALWLKEREEKKAQLERAWKPPMLVMSSSLKRKLPPPRDHRRNSSQSEQSSEAESAVNSPLNEPLNVDILAEDATETKPSIPVPTPTSPLLTSLLKTPSPVTTPQTSSILHNAITSQRDTSPTIASLLSSSPGVPHVGVGQQPQVQQPSTTAGAPTLSMLLELPASAPGKPLPELPSVQATSADAKMEPAVTTPTTQAEDLHHPQHQQMRVRKATETDEILEVVELEQQSESEDRSNPIEIGLEEIIANLEAAENVRDDLLQQEIVMMDTTPSDSSTLFDSFLKSMDNTKDKTSVSTQIAGLSQNVSAVDVSRIPISQVIGVETTGEMKKEEKIQTPTSKVMTEIEEVNSILEENTKLIKESELKKESGKTDTDTLDEDLNLLLETSDLQSELIDTVGGQADISTEEFDAQSLAEMEVIIMDKVQEMEEQDMKKSELDLATRSAILEIVLGSETAAAELEEKTQQAKSNLDVSSEPEKETAPEVVPKKEVIQEVKKSVEKVPEEPKVFDKFDEMVNEGLPKRKDGKPKEVTAKVVTTAHVEEVIVEKVVEEKNIKVAETKSVAKTEEPQVNDQPTPEEPKSEAKVDKPVDEIKVPAVEESNIVQEEVPSIVVKDTEEDKSVVSSQESTDETEEAQFPETSRSKQETNRAETPLTETSDAEQPLSSSIRSYGRHTVTPAIDSVPNSPASVLTEDEREYRAWKKAIMLVWSRMASHKFASLFLKPITDDQAPLYSMRIKKPIDLMAIKRSVETGATRNTVDFQRDTLLMFLNAQMYNNCLHRVYNMAKEMQEDSMLLIRDFVETQKLVQSAGEVTSLRRETRTTDAMKRDDSDGPRTPLSFKRKRISDLEKISNKKIKVG